jgi:hypothetical protein
MPLETCPTPAEVPSNFIRAYERRRTWSRTDSARWLSDRSAPLLAALRRRPGQWPSHSRMVGYWLKDNATAIFDAAHARLLAAKDDTARDALLPTDLIK